MGKFMSTVLLRTALGVVCILLVFLFCAKLFSPRLPPLSKIPRPSKENLAALAELKDQSIDEKNPLRIQVDVDYSQGREAPWYPKDEAPVLRELVEEGKLPPIEERVGPEPLVMRSLCGPGKYGGSMYRLNDVGNHRMKPVGLVRWSPQGYPIVPNLAKSFTVSEDARTYTFNLRKGVKWSDGHPFTSADILYFWIDEQLNKSICPQGPDQSYFHRGKPMKVEAPDPYTVIFSFEDPNSLFLEKLATDRGMIVTRSPKHFMERFHPEKGDRNLIRNVMEAHNLINERAVYLLMQSRVELPRLDPWIMQTERMTPPDTYVRNPYFFAVDEKGRQLPYVDRIVVNQKSSDMLVISASQGEVTMQSRYIRNDAYTMLMKQRKQYGYHVYQWQNGDGALGGVSFNLNRRVPAGDKEVEQKAILLKDKRFRQALSMAVNKQEIIDALYMGMGEPASFQAAKLSPFYFPDLDEKYGKYNPDKANELLDACGLTSRDADGYRKFPDGPTLLFDLNFCPFTGEGPGQFLIEYWRKAGIKAALRAQDRTVFSVEQKAGLHDMSIWGGYGDFLPILSGISAYFPSSSLSDYATKYGTWYADGGIYKKEGETVKGVKPPEDHPCYQGMVLYENLKMAKSREEQKELFRKMVELAAENVYNLTISTPLTALAVVKDGFNVSSKGVYSWTFLSPGNFGPETWYFDDPRDDKSERQDIKNEISRVSPLKSLQGGEAPSVVKNVSAGLDSRSFAAAIIKWGILISIIMLMSLLVLRYPYIGKRILIMVPTLLIISIISFIVIELPPGDAISSRIIQMQESGGDVDQTQIDQMKVLFRTELPAWQRYTWWMGFDWFASFDRKDQGLLQGNLGRSMMDLKPVNQKVGDRIMFTFLISLGTLLLTWVIALPIGIYSAVRQYSFFDYFFTVVGFVGMCIPGFLLALLLMFAAETLFGLKVSGLFSNEYAAQSGWSMGKVIDLLKHLWLPIFVQAISGTAGMIRVMRANLLDELKKPYVTTARAKGVRPLNLLLKYPVRVALNPFVSGIGSIFPHLISSGAIVAIVMSLPTIGPMQLTAVMQQDMYLAGSMLMILSVLSVIGTLVSDILLIALDPRIRFQGGGK